MCPNEIQSKSKLAARFSDVKQQPPLSQLIIFSKQEASSRNSSYLISTCHRRLLKNCIQSCGMSKLPPPKELTSLATADRAKAKPPSKPCPGRPTMQPRGGLHQHLQKCSGQSISVKVLPQFLSKPNLDSPAAWHSPHVSHVIQLPKWEPHLCCL